MSTNQFVGRGIAVEDEDDEYSSSEESEEKMALFLFSHSE
jgi:hypothetical protein